MQVLKKIIFLQNTFPLDSCIYLNLHTIFMPPRQVSFMMLISSLVNMYRFPVMDWKCSTYRENLSLGKRK